MELTIIAGQPIKFFVAMEVDTTRAFQAADSNPTLNVAAKNGASVTPGVGEVVIANVLANRGYYVTFTPATLPVIGDEYVLQFLYVVSGVTYYLTYEGIAVASAASATASVTVMPVAGNAPDRIEKTTIKAFTGEDWSEPISGIDANGDAIDFSALGTLQFTICDSRGTEVLQIDDGSITTTSTTFTVTIPASVLVYGTVLHWSLRDLDDGDRVVLYGPIEVQYAAKAT